MKFTIEQLKAIMPRMVRNPKTCAALFPHLQAAMTEAQIDTPLRAAAFLAQLAHESGEFRYMEELASGKAYESRTDLGNTPEDDGDGPKYKGRGPIQITGKANYQAITNALGVDFVNQPELAATYQYGFRIAGWYWTKHKLNALADIPDFRKITRKINGGYNGLEDREKFYSRARQVLGA